VLTVVDGQITRLDQQLAELGARSEDWQLRDNILRSAPGVGAVTSHVLFAELPELGQLEHKPLAKLVGLAPLNRDSEKLRGRRMFLAGRAAVRTALYMAALSARRFNPPVRRVYQRLRQAGKTFNVAISACTRNCLPSSMPRSATTPPGENRSWILEIQHSRSCHHPINRRLELPARGECQEFAGLVDLSSAAATALDATL
jgi:transposase